MVQKEASQEQHTYGSKRSITSISYILSENKHQKVTNIWSKISITKANLVFYGCEFPQPRPRATENFLASLALQRKDGNTVLSRVSVTDLLTETQSSPVTALVKMPYPSCMKQYRNQERNIRGTSAVMYQKQWLIIGICLGPVS